MNESCVSSCQIVCKYVDASMIEDIARDLDDLGGKSAQAQLLKSSITSYSIVKSSWVSGLRQDIIAAIDTVQGAVVGFIKFGWRDLFLYSVKGVCCQKKSLCCLDFYVADSYQRCGVGHMLFESFLKQNSISPNHVAYDRPSFRLLSFLSKYYSLTNPQPQPNKYTIYEGFLES